MSRAIQSSGRIGLACLRTKEPLMLASITCRRHMASVPAIASTSFWKSMIPKPFRGDGRPKAKIKTQKKKEWNPATFYIVMFILIGSMSINLIAIKQDLGQTMRRADNQIAKLRDVVERIQRGETVDVEKALGTGDPAQELEWEQLMRDIEREDTLYNQKQPRVKKNADTPNAKTQTANATATEPRKSADFF